MAETDCACTTVQSYIMRRGIPGIPGSSKRAELVSGCVGFGSPAAAVAVVDGVAAEIALWDGLIPVERVGSQTVVAVVAGITLSGCC